MRFLAATFLLAAACGGTQRKPEGAIVNEGSATPDTCCCKTMPDTAEKEIVPVYKMQGRMECSSVHGDCVDDVQCNASAPTTGDNGPAPSGKGDTGVPPPPDLPPGKN